MFTTSSFLVAFIGPGGPEFILVMLVLLMMFGAKDAPRILRKLNEIFNQLRNTADGFKREVMYGDLSHDKSSYEPPDNTDESSFDEDGYYDYGEDDGGDGEEFQPSEDAPEDEPVEGAPEPDAEDGDSEDEEGDAQKI